MGTTPDISAGTLISFCLAMLINPNELRLRAAHYRLVASTRTNGSHADRRLFALASGLERQADVLEQLMKHADVDEGDLA